MMKQKYILLFGLTSISFILSFASMSVGYIFDCDSFSNEVIKQTCSEEGIQFSIGLLGLAAFFIILTIFIAVFTKEKSDLLQDGKYD